MEDFPDEAGACPVCGAAGYSCRTEALERVIESGGGIRITREATREETTEHAGVRITRLVRLGEGEERRMYKLGTRTYVNADSTKVVDEGSADAAFLLGNEGDEISAETAERLGLGKSDVAYASMKKAELVELADRRGVDSSGTIAEIAERLDAADAEAASGTADQGSPEATSSTESPAAVTPA